MSALNNINHQNAVKVIGIAPPLTRPKQEKILEAKNKGDTDYDQRFSSVISLNVGGFEYTTSLNTLMKYEGSMLTAMFSGRHKLYVDPQGRYFIDRDGETFKHILNFLRTGALPPLKDTLAVYEEAEYFNIQPLINILNSTKPVAGQRLRNEFLEKVPNYHKNVAMLIAKLQHNAGQTQARLTKVLVSIVKEDGPVNPYENCILPPFSAECETITLKRCRKTHSCNVDATFGPWRAAPDVLDLIDCIKIDFSVRGYDLEPTCIGTCDEVLFDCFNCKRPIYEFKIKWW